MPGFNEVSPTQLMRRLGGPDAPVLIDLTVDDDFRDDPFLIPTARRCHHQDHANLIEQARGGDIVLICQKGRKLSHGGAAVLRAHGIACEVLAGGNFAWRAASLPRVPSSSLSNVETGGTRWVTRHRPKIDRIACPWLIRRFVDPAAEFLFVPPGDVLAVADRFDAVPFDIEGVHWSHRGENCTFDARVSDFGLTHDPIERVAKVVRAADTDQLESVPQAAGLLALSVGLSRLYKDDNRQLDAGVAIYDALYRWARDGFEEGHTWPTSR
ncbi:MAG: chromate resistance protein ChrB domain-containing protein [Paracoccaceae bacterium]